MASEDELARLVVRLVGEGGDYTEMITRATEETAHASDEIAHHVHEIHSEAITEGELVKDAIENVVEKLNELGHEAFTAFLTHEQIELKLRAAIESNGHAVETTMEKYEEFAGKMSHATTSGGAQVLSMLQLAESMGLTGAAAERATRNAIGLAAAHGLGEMAAIRMAAGLEQGVVGRLQRYIPQLKNITDESQKVAFAQDALSKKFAVAEAVAKSTGGAMTQLHNQFHALFAELGKFTAAPINLVTESIKTVVEYVRSFSDESKKLVVQIAAVASVLLPLIAYLNGVGPALWVVAKATQAINLVMGILAGVMSPIGLAVLVVTGALVLFVRYMGGVEATWKKITTAAQAFWNYVKPIFFQIADMAQDAFNSMLFIADYVFETIANFVGTTWNGISDGIGKVAMAIRDGFSDALIFVEFAFMNMGRFAELAWVDFQLGIEKTVSVFQHVFTVAIPAYVAWFGRNYADIILAMADVTVNFFTNLISNVVAIFTNLPGLISGAVSFADLWTPLLDGFVQTVEKLPDIGERQIGDLEKKLQDEADKLSVGLGEDFAKFREGKLEGFNKELEKEGEKTEAVASAIGKKAAAGLNKFIKFDAAEFGSSEALSRFAEFADLIQGSTEEDQTGKKGHKGGGKNVGGPAVAAGSGGGAPTVTGQQIVSSGTDKFSKVEQHLATLVALTRKQVGKGSIPVFDAEIA